MPGVKKYLPAKTIDAEHPGRLAIFQNVDGVVAIERVWLGSGFLARELLIQILLGDFGSLFRGHSHRRRDRTGIAIVTAHHAVTSAHHAIATHHSTSAAHVAIFQVCLL